MNAESPFTSQFTQNSMNAASNSAKFPVDVVLDDDALRVLIEDLKILLTEELWKQARKDCAVRSQILNSLAEAIIILPTVALEHSNDPSDPLDS